MMIRERSSDDAYCEAFYQDYLSASEEDKEVVSLKNAAKMLGVSKATEASTGILMTGDVILEW